MNKVYSYIFLVLCGLAISACVLVEESEIDEPEATELVSLSFTASTESTTFTKATMTGSVGEGTHKLLWCPYDAIGIIPLVESGYCDHSEFCFENSLSEHSQTAVFKGQAANAESYLAVYPFGLTGVYHGIFEPVLPYVHPETSQIDIPINLPNYSFMDASGDDLLYDFPMVAKFDAGSDISFYNLCGILALSLTGKETISRITFVAEGDRKVSGEFSLSWLDDQLTLTPTSNSRNDLSIYPYVTLKEDEPTVFYFRLPPQIYDSFNILIVSSEGTKMIKHADKPLEIKRSVLTPSGTLEFVETYPIDLSEFGTANCYMVHEAGVYSFDASIIGNGNDGIISDAGYHVSTAEIEPQEAYMAWNEGPVEVISDVSYNPETKRVSFFVSGIEGNATIYVYDSGYNTLWNWHIWVTDKPTEQTYTNSVGTFVIQDRNLGATRADRGQGEQWKESIGLRYQWGRVSPLFKDVIYPYWYDYFQSINESLDAIFSVACGPTWLSPMNTKLWSASQKTIYDPCPLGYRVANNDAFADFKTTGTMDMGWNVDYSSGVTAWYPVIPNLSLAEYELVEEITNEGYIWTADECSLQYGHTLHYSSSGFDLTMNRTVSDLFPVRCMKDENYFTLEVPVLGTVQVHDVKVDSAVISFDIRHEGASEVTECGIIYGVTSGDLLENGTKVPASGDACQVQLIGLAEGTKYYAMAYATNAHGTSYSKEKSFQTRHLNGVDLSENGTSNCYMISSPDSYFFDASVKGNSNESVGSPVEVEVLWETKNTTAEVSVGDIVNNVILTDGTIYFEATGTPGNALIAVKDATGTIIWSWHIWVSDYDPDENYCTYLSGAVMMDRNLGALNCGYDPESFGLLYQWGRKDPLLGSADGSQTFATTAPVVNKQQFNVSNPVEYTFANPIHRVDDLNNDASAWGRTKTMYDPCPPGWRVPDGGSDGVWNGMIYGSPGIESLYDSSSALVYWVINPPYSTPATTYPAPGYTDESSGVSLMFPGSALYCWSCDYANEIRAYAMHLFNRIERELKAGKEDEFSVRCMKE